MRKIRNIREIKNIPGFLITILFFATILMSVVLFNTKPGKESAAENRRLTEFPALKTPEGALLADPYAAVCGWFEDNLGLRDVYLTISGILNYNLLHRAKTPKVELGKEGFLYLTEDGNLSLEASKQKDFVDRIPEYASDQQQIADKLKSQGIDYVLMITPGKPSVYPEYIASSTHGNEDTIGDAMYEYLRDNTDVHVVWSKDKLIEAKDNEKGELIYFKTDTHWTTYGRNIAYRDLITSLNDWKLTDTAWAEVEFYKSDDAYVGDLSNMMGPVTWSGERLKEDSFTDWKVSSANAEVIDSGEGFEEFQQMLSDKNVYNPELCVMYHNASAPDKKVLICGDSMVGVCLLPELAECFSDMTFIWSYRLDQDYIDFVKPDLVISQLGERQLAIRSDDIRNYIE